MSITAAASGSLTLTDSAANTSTLAKQLSSGSFAGTEFGVAQSLLISNVATPITLPISPVQFAYIKNLSGAATLTVTWTPNGGASNPVITLQPGAFILFSEPTAGGGITALSLQASAVSTPVEFWLLG